MVANLMVSAKLATLGPFKKVFLKNGYDVIIFVHDATGKVSSCASNYIVNVVNWPKFGNFSISMRQMIITLIL